MIVTFFAEFFRTRLKGPIVVAFDEIDVVQLYHYYTDNFFEAVRALASHRDVLDMSFVLIGLNHPKDLFKSISSGAFNISGLHIALDDFDAEDAATVDAWAQGYSAENDADRLAIAKTILIATGGQPFLTSWIFDKARKNAIQKPNLIAPLVEELIEDAKNGEGIAAHF